MRRILPAILLPAAIILSLPSCEAVPEDESYVFRTDTCVLVNERPTDPNDDGNGVPDLEILPPCTDPYGCTDPASGYHYHTYFDEDGGYFNVPGNCPPWQPDTKVEADSLAEAVEACDDAFGHLCRSLCICHGGTAVLQAGSAQACAQPADTYTYACGCVCDVPS